MGLVALLWAQLPPSLGPHQAGSAGALSAHPKGPVMLAEGNCCRGWIIITWDRQPWKGLRRELVCRWGWRALGDWLSSSPAWKGP